jgi:DNA polymerase-3 subunit beta
MRILTTKNHLLESINIVEKAVPSKTTLPILEGILFTAESGRLILTATDLELGIETNLEVDVLEPGSLVMAADTIGNIVRKLPDADVEIATKDGFIIIKSEGTEIEILGLPQEEFPKLPEVDKEFELSMPDSSLKEMIRQTIFAVSNDEIRPILTGALLEVTGDRVTMAALDGYRMAVKSCNLLSDTNIKAVIPGKTLMELGKIIEEKDEVIHIFVSKNQVLFNLGDTTIISRLLEGEFVNYKQLIPNEHNIKIKIEKAKLLEACDRAALFAKDSGKTIRFEIFDDILNIRSNSEKGNVHEEMKIEKSGGDIEIAFNPRYILEALKVINSEEVEVEFTTNVSPSIIRPSKDTGFLYLVLPVRRR